MTRYVLWCETAASGDQDEGRGSVLIWMTGRGLDEGSGSRK